MEPAEFILWLIAAALTLGLATLAVWQVWAHRRLDERVAACDPSLLSSLTHKVEASTDAPSGSAVVPYVPVHMVALQAPVSQEINALPEPVFE